jgi:hypothetical protein
MKKERKCNPNKLEFGNVRSQKSLYYKRLISWKQTSDIAIPIPTVEGRIQKFTSVVIALQLTIRFRVKTYVKKMSSVDEPMNLTITECESALSCESKGRIM